MKIYVAAIVWAVLIVVGVRLVIVHCIKCYFTRKAKKMTDMELLRAQIKAWESGWFHKLKHKIYVKEFERRPRIIPPSHID